MNPQRTPSRSRATVDPSLRDTVSQESFAVDASEGTREVIERSGESFNFKVSRSNRSSIGRSRVVSSINASKRTREVTGRSGESFNFKVSSSKRSSTVAEFVGSVLSAMSENREEFRKEETVGTGSPTVAVPASCRKKKSDVNEGFVKDIISHIDEFVSASYDEHKSCLQKTVRKMFNMNKAVGTSAFAPPPVVSVLPLRVDTSTEQNAQL